MLSIKKAIYKLKLVALNSKQFLKSFSHKNYKAMFHANDVITKNKLEIGFR